MAERIIVSVVTQILHSNMAELKSGESYISTMFSDLLVVFRQYGQPHCFITFSWNPNWKELRQIKAACNSSVARSDLIRRVFTLKLGRLFMYFQNELLKKPYIHIKVYQCDTRAYILVYKCIVCFVSQLIFDIGIFQFLFTLLLFLRKFASLIRWSTK